MSASSPLWWYASDNQKFGPYTEAQLRQLGQEGYIRRHDLVWHQGLDNWVPATSIDGLATTDTPPPLPTEQPAAAEDGAWTETALNTFEQPNGQNWQAVFVGKNYDFYARKWAAMEQAPANAPDQPHAQKLPQAATLFGSLSWNWAAFFLGIFWLAYRKMYLYLAAVFASAFTLGILTTWLKIPLQELIKWQLPIELSVRTAFGLFGNYLYKMHTEKTIRQVTAASTDAEHIEQKLAQHGGTNLLFAIGLVVVVFFMAVQLSLQN